MKRCISILFFWPMLALATISMRIEPTTVQPGQSVRLILTQENQAPVNATPDLTPLRNEFNLVGTEHNISYTAQNGTTTTQNQWVILLIPKKIGTLTLPAIKIGNEMSPSGQVNVTTAASLPVHDDTTEDSVEDSHSITLQADVDEHHPFVSQQIIYTVKLVTNQSLLEAQYQPPRADNAIMVAFGEGRRYQTTIKGQEYSVDEQKYAIYPQKSGPLTINPPQISAVVYDAMPERVQATGKPIELIVKPTPQQNTSHQWTPAQRLTLSEQYEPTDLTIKQGNTLTRTISMHAIGLPGELLPVLHFPNHSQYNVYPEKPETHNRVSQHNVIGMQDIRVTYLLNQPGLIKLPAIRVHWFNTRTKQQETTILPSRQITVIKSRGQTAPAKQTTKPNASVQTTPTPIATDPSLNASHVNTLAWWVAGGFAFIWVVTLLLWWQFHIIKKKPIDSKPKHSKRKKQSELRTVCLSNDPHQTKDALLKWGAQQWPNVTPLTLEKLANIVYDTRLKEEIYQLSAAIYANTSTYSWTGKALWKALEQYQPLKANPKSKPNPLPPLNPEF